MSIFWKTFLGGMLCIALMFGATYAKGWIKHHTRGERMGQAEQIRLKNEAIDRAVQQSYRQFSAPPRGPQPSHSRAPIKPPPFYNKPIKPPNFAQHRN
jgi:hypothetical protein